MLGSFSLGIGLRRIIDTRLTEDSSLRGPDSDPAAIAAELRRIAPVGVDRALDSTGVKDVMLDAIYSLGYHGVFCYVSGTGGVPLDLDLNRILIKGVSIRGVMGGDGTGLVFLRELIRFYEEGRLPIERLVRKYPFDDINQALADMASGVTIKPVLVFDGAELE